MKSAVTETIEIMQRVDIYRTHILISLTTSPRFTHTNATPAGHDAPRFRVHPTIQNHNKKKHGQDVISKNRHPFREIPNYETDSLVVGS